MTLVERASSLGGQLRAAARVSEKSREMDALIRYFETLLAKHGVVAITAAISPYRAIRDEARAKARAPFVEVFVDAPLAVVEARDVKGLYKKARAGEIPAFTGVSDPYEPPFAPEVVVKTGEESIEQSAAKVLAHLAAIGVIA